MWRNRFAGKPSGRSFQEMAIHSVRLEDRGVLRIAGEDATGFLQGLLTNDVEGLAVGAARYAALLSPQGKILFDFLVLRIPADSGATFLIDCLASQAGELAKRLGFYRLRAKVAVTDESAGHAVVAFWGDDGTPAPGGLAGGFVYVDPRDDRLGARAILLRAEAAGIGAAADEYETHRIALGVPKGGVDFAFADIFPHDANLDLLHGVDFEKGCYVGQEVVSRMRHRGGARKRIVRLNLSGPAPEPGAPVLAGEISVGALGSVAARRGLAMVRLDRVEEAQATGRLLTVGGVRVAIETP
jgi:folate-binding protein YgfZ